MLITKEQKKSIPFKYAQDVLSGKLLVGLRVKQAIDRFFTWIEEADDKGFYLDHKKGMMIIKFFEELLVHTKGKSAGSSFKLSPFQQFTLYNVFGWMQKTPQGDVRRINNVYEKIAKKNGKTAVMAGVALYHCSFDMEKGAEAYVGATKEEQAKLCFSQACDFINASPLLKKLGFRVLQKEIQFTPTSSIIKPLGGDSKTQDGINSSLSIIDEYHAHRDDSVKENLESSMASRKQPLVYTITTAGTNISGVCKNFEDSCISILEGQLSDEHFFIMIHDLDEDDDWNDSRCWVKANPNLGVNVSIDFLQKEYQKAVNQPSKAPNFKTKHLNKWVDAPEIWIPSEVWNANKYQGDDFLYTFIKKCKDYGSIAAVDLSSTTDLTALIYITNPDEYGKQYLKPYFFCPKSTIESRSREDRVPYRYWMDAGHLIATEGNRVDYDEILNVIVRNSPLFKVERFEFDKWNADALEGRVKESGYETSYFSQAIGVISYPTKQFEKAVYDGDLIHDDNPVLKWNLSGCVIYRDANDNYKVHKGKSHQGVKRVDGIVASIMAFGGTIKIEDDSNESQYNDPDIEFNFGIKTSK